MEASGSRWKSCLRKERSEWKLVTNLDGSCRRDAWKPWISILLTYMGASLLEASIGLPLGSLGSWTDVKWNFWKLDILCVKRRVWEVEWKSSRSLKVECRSNGSRVEASTRTSNNEVDPTAPTVRSRARSISCTESHGLRRVQAWYASITIWADSRVCMWRTPVVRIFVPASTCHSKMRWRCQAIVRWELLRQLHKDGSPVSSKRKIG